MNNIIYYILLLVLILGGLIVFALQNSSPVVLTFLGVKTIGLPLGFSILAAIGAGFLTALIIFGLFQLSDYFSSQSLRERIRQLEAEKSRNRWQRSTTNPASESTSYSTQNNAAQWETTAPTDRDYVTQQEQEEQAEETVRDNPNYQVYSPPNTSYERPQEPTTRSQSGSVYSYSYQNPKNSSVGKRESVYDAEYRIITPPYRSPEPNVTENDADWEAPKNKNNDDDEDWGFDDDEEEFDDTDDRTPYR